MESTNTEYFANHVIQFVEVNRCFERNFLTVGLDISQNFVKKYKNRKHLGMLQAYFKFNSVKKQHVFMSMSVYIQNATYCACSWMHNGPRRNELNSQVYQN